jgi:hypothetical protein
MEEVMVDENETGWWRTLGILVGVVPSRTEQGNYKFTGNPHDPEWERFKRDNQRDKEDGFN